MKVAVQAEEEKRIMRHVIISSLVLNFLLACAVNIEEIPTRAVEYEPPPYKYLLAVNTKGFYAADKSNPARWQRVGGKVMNLDYSSFTSIENLYAAHYCNGIWLVAGQIVGVDMEAGKEVGSYHRNRMAVYWTDRQSPITDWNYYEITNLSDNLRRDRMYPRGITCNEYTGTWYIAGNYWLLTSNNPTAAKNWTLTHTTDIVPSRGLLAVKGIGSFEDFVYAGFHERVKNTGYLGLKVGDEPWEFIHLNNDLGLPPSRLHSFLFDPTINKIIIGTTWPWVIYCETASLVCTLLPVRKGTDSMATNYEGQVFGTSVTVGTTIRMPGVSEWDVDEQGKNFYVLVPRIYATNLVFLDDRWYIAGHFGNMGVADYKQVRRSGWRNPQNCANDTPTGIGQCYNYQYSIPIVDGVEEGYALGDQFEGRHFTDLILGGL